MPGRRLPPHTANSHTQQQIGSSEQPYAYSLTHKPPQIGYSAHAKGLATAMPRQAIAEENRTGEGGDRFPKLKLQEKGEKARICLFEPVWAEWVHNLRAPQIEDGVVKKKDMPQRNGGTKSVFDLEFIGMPICLGDPDILRDSKDHMDPGNCPACAAEKEAGGDADLRPVQRFAANVIRYDLRAGSWDLRVPFNAQILLWAFTGRIHDELLDIQREIGDIRQHDITLECEDPYFARNKLRFKLTPGYREAGPEAINLLKQLLADPTNKATDDQLKDACGRTSARAYMQEDVDTVLRRWRQVALLGSGGAPDPASGTATPDLEGGIDALLGNSPAADAGGLFGDSPAGQRAAAAHPGGLSEFATAEQKAASVRPEDAMANAQIAQAAAIAQAQPATVAATTENIFDAPAADPTVPATPPTGAAAPTGTVSTPAPVDGPATTPAAPPSEPGRKLDFEDLLAGLS